MFDATYILGYSYLISQIASNVPWTCIFLLLQFFGIRMYVVHDREICKRIQKRVNSRSSKTVDGNKGIGYSVGFWYLISISMESSYDEADTYDVWMIATAASYEFLTKEREEAMKFDSDNMPIEKTPLKVYDRQGSFMNPYFRCRDLKITSVSPRPDQQAIIDQIRKHHDLNEHTVVYLHGPPGSGKSLVGILLANEYKGSYCNTLKPWQPGDTLSGLYSEAEPTEDSPLVVVFDEFDGALIRIHSGIEPHKNLPTQIQDKAGWNQMLDEIQRGMYPHLIMLLTSNKGPEFIQSLDPSYIRKGRVDITVELS